jgi:hypothetical protein
MARFAVNCQEKIRMAAANASTLLKTRVRVLTCLVGIMMPIFSMALANSSGSTKPELFRSKYLNAFWRTASSEATPEDFCYNLFFNSLSKLYKSQTGCGGDAVSGAHR